MFQSLLGILKSFYLGGETNDGLTVSIPPRYSKIFDSGTQYVEWVSQFQSLLGILKSGTGKGEVQKAGAEFQSLLGILKSFVTSELATLIASFNPS